MKAVLLLLGLAGGAWTVLQPPAPQPLASFEEPCVSYWSTGVHKASTRYRDGVPHGLAREWHRNGRLAAEGWYSAGLRDGEWVFWSADGTLDPLRSGLYRAGRKAR